MDKRRVIYYRDELNDEFSTAKIEARHIGRDYVYIKSTPFKKFTHFFWYRIIATPIAFFYTKIAHRHKIVGKEKLRGIEGGYFLFGNHTHAIADAAIPSMLSMPRDAYVIVHPANVSIPFIGRVAGSLGALPLPSEIGAMRNFLAAVKYRYGEGKAIVIYPEAHIWPYYTGIRPFGDGSFHYPVKLNAPVFAFTNTYKRRRFSKKPRIVTYIDGPFFPDMTLSQNERRRALRDAVYGAMCERAKMSDVAVIEYRKVDSNDG